MTKEEEHRVAEKKLIRTLYNARKVYAKGETIIIDMPSADLAETFVRRATALTSDELMSRCIITGELSKNHQIPALTRENIKGQCERYSKQFKSLSKKKALSPS